MLDQEILGNSLMTWAISAGIIVAAFLLGRFLAYGLRLFSRRMGSFVISCMLEQLDGPLTNLVLVMGVRLAVAPLNLPENVRTLVAQGLMFTFVMVLTWLTVKAYDGVHKGIFVPYSRKPDAAIELHVFALLQTVVNTLLWTIGLASALNSIGFEVSAILAGLGIGGMALALAAQDTVANVFGGILVLLQRPFRVGERIEVNGVNGWVTQVGLRNTTVRNWYGREMLIPNKKFTDSVVINIDSQGVYFQELRLRLDPRTPVAQLEQAMKILHDIVQEHALLDKTPWVAFDKIEFGYLELEFWYAIPRWTPLEKDKIPNEYEKICRGKTLVNLEILKRFEAAGIQLAVPTEVHFQVPGPLRVPEGTHNAPR